MSGAKRRTPYRKQVTAAVLHDRPEPGVGQRVAIVLRSHGSNLLEVAAGGDGGDIAPGLAMLPTKFRKLVWIKRGDPVIVSEATGEYDTAAGGSGRVRYLIEHVLYGDQVRHLRAVNKWPAELDGVIATSDTAASGGSGGAAGSDDRVTHPAGKLGVVAGGAGGGSLSTLAAKTGAGGGATAALVALRAKEAAEGSGDEGSDGGDGGDATATWMARHRGGPRGMPPSDSEDEDDEEDEGGGSDDEAAR